MVGQHSGAQILLLMRTTWETVEIPMVRWYPMPIKPKYPGVGATHQHTQRVPREFSVPPSLGTTGLVGEGKCGELDQ